MVVVTSCVHAPTLLAPSLVVLVLQVTRSTLATSVWILMSVLPTMVVVILLLFAPTPSALANALAPLVSLGLASAPAQTSTNAMSTTAVALPFAHALTRWAPSRVHNVLLATAQRAMTVN